MKTSCVTVAFRSFDLDRPMTEAEHEELIDGYRKRFDTLADRAIGEISEMLAQQSRRGLPEGR